MKIVCWTKQRRTGFSSTEDTDHWECFEELSEAKKRYAEIVKRDDTFVASICSIIESTDYDLKEVKND